MWSAVTIFFIITVGSDIKTIARFIHEFDTEAQCQAFLQSDDWKNRQERLREEFIIRRTDKFGISSNCLEGKRK